MLITFWCDSDITFLHGLHNKIGDSTLCGAGGDASFAPQANLVYIIFFTSSFKI